MEKIKNIVNPGGSKEAEILYGSGHAGDPGASGNTSRSTGPGSHLPGGIGTHANDPTATSGTTAGPHTTNLANRLDPRVDSDRDGSRTLERGQDPLAGNVNKPLPHTPASFTGNPGSGATYGSLPDRTVPSSGTYGTAPVAGDTYPSSGTTSHATGPHSSALANKLDPRVDSDRDGSQTYGSTQAPHHGTGVLGGAGILGTGTTTHTHDPSINTSGSTTTSSGLHRDTSLRTHYHTLHGPHVPHGHDVEWVEGPREGHSHHVDPTVPLAAGTAALAGTGHSDPHHSSTGSAPLVAGTTTTSGPHSTNLANKLDPRVDSDRYGTTDSHRGRDAGILGGTAAAATAGYVAGRPHGDRDDRAMAVGPSSDNRALPSVADPAHSGHHYGRDAALAGGTAVAGGAALHGSHSDRDGRPLPAYDPKDDRPHHTGTTDPAHSSHHYGRDAALAGGAAAGGAALYASQSDRDARPLPPYDPKDDPRDHRPYHADTTHHKEDKEKKGHGILGFLHSDKDKDKHHEDTHRKTTTEHEKEKQHGIGLFHHDKDKTKEKHHEETHHQKTTEHEKSKSHGIGLFHHDKDKTKEKHHEEPIRGMALTGTEATEAQGLLHTTDRGVEPTKGYALTGKEAFDQHDTAHHLPGQPGKNYAADDHVPYDVHHHGVTTTATDADGRTRLHKDPPREYAREVLAREGRGTDLDGDEQRRREANLPGGMVVEPHTGLPMNVGKYGTGQGGTDGGPVKGYHHH